jgi:hypothetical protein
MRAMQRRRPDRRRCRRDNSEREGAEAYLDRSVRLRGAGGVPATFRDAAQVLDEHIAISPDAGPSRGTAIPQDARAGFVMLDSRSRVEPGPTRYHHVRYHVRGSLS